LASTGATSEIDLLQESITKRPLIDKSQLGSFYYEQRKAVEILLRKDIQTVFNNKTIASEKTRNANLEFERYLAE
jgi:hypothetical protein